MAEDYSDPIEVTTWAAGSGTLTGTLDATAIGYVVHSGYGVLTGTLGLVAVGDAPDALPPAEGFGILTGVLSASAEGYAVHSGYGVLTGVLGAVAVARTEDVLPDDSRIWHAAKRSWVWRVRRMGLATKVISADVDDDEVYGLDFTDKLPTGVTISNVTIEHDLGDDFTLAGTVNTAAVEYIEGQRNYTAAIGTFVTFEITEAPAADYRIKVIATCSDGKVRSETVRLKVAEWLTQE